MNVFVECDIAESYEIKTIQDSTIEDLEYIKHKGLNRTYRLFVPSRANNKYKKYPVVINFHGSRGNALQHKKLTRMNKTAEKYGFVVIYPNGTNPFCSTKLYWNSGFSCSMPNISKVDDVGFILSILQKVSSKIPIDSSRVYATGFSNGAMMTYKLANDISMHIAAIAPVAGTMITNNFNPKRKISVMHIHSVDDPVIPFFVVQKGKKSLFKLKLRYSVFDIIKRWINFNHCPELPITDKIIVMGDSSKRSNSRLNKQSAVKYRFSCGFNGNEVILWMLFGAGHVWPGGNYSIITTSYYGQTTDIINANEEMWNFFKKFSLNQ